MSLTVDLNATIWLPRFKVLAQLPERILKLCRSQRDGRIERVEISGELGIESSGKLVEAVFDHAV